MRVLGLIAVVLLGVLVAALVLFLPGGGPSNEPSSTSPSAPLTASQLIAESYEWMQRAGATVAAEYGFGFVTCTASETWTPGDVMSCAPFNKDGTPAGGNMGLYCPAAVIMLPNGAIHIETANGTYVCASS